MSGFDSVLVANRGEIAVRVLRSARELGYHTVAVFSEADAQSLHVALADEALLIGPAPVAESYLDASRILEAARRSGAQAVHPGYGFLSENAAFARACCDAGLVFIGPSPAAIELMGNKAAAKRRMLAAGVPCIPGYQEPQAGDDALGAAADSIGYPLMVKAAAGGGGRGMRLVENAAALPEALAAARSEAQRAFGSGELILERALRRPRHVEVQVFGDSHGNHIHLGERDCSVQRRHQKVVEEAPCPAMTPALRRTMGEAAVAAARSIDYVGAGTVEFLLDEDGQFYFLEMNTRLQVEHPVTECVTGQDLVALQLQVAQGEVLPMGQEDVRLDGHAIEVRLYAEDVSNDFLPASGRAVDWEPPTGRGIRVDHGLQSGQEITPFYDPMIAKVIASGADRETARRRLLRALRDTVILGVPTNRRFLLDVLARESFAAGAATTAFIAEEFPGGVPVPVPEEDMFCLAALLQYLQAAEASLLRRVSDDTVVGAADSLRRLPSRFAYIRGDDADPREVTVTADGDDCYRVALDGIDRELELIDVPAEGRLRVAIDGAQGNLAFAFPERGEVLLQWRGRDAAFVNLLAFSAAERRGAGSGSVLAPMHGNVLRVLVSAGDVVAVGDALAVMEAMKMEHRLVASVDGVVAAVYCSEGQQLAAGSAVMDIEPQA